MVVKMSKSGILPTKKKKTRIGDGKFTKKTRAGGETFYNNHRAGSSPNRFRRRKKTYRGQGK